MQYLYQQQPIKNSSKSLMSSQEAMKKQPQKCIKCLTFFGSAVYQGMCSSCHGKLFPKSKQPVKKPVQKEQVATDKYKGQHKGVQADKTKCFDCNRKVGILGTQCKCNYVFCNKHRMPQDHKCTYNFEAEAKDELKKQLIKIDHLKIKKLSKQQSHDN